MNGMQTYRHNNDNTDDQLQPDGSNRGVRPVTQLVEELRVWQAAITGHSPDQMCTSQD